MKVLYKNLIDRIKSSPSIEDVSSKLFQLGHENSIIGDILDIEFTPNRGDCLSINGILRELSVFYDIKDKPKIYKDTIDKLKIDFTNKNIEICPKISFLKIEINENVNDYSPILNNYFDGLDVKKNNFFTDVSNYLSYETGQPTHCYDFDKLSGNLVFEVNKIDDVFETITGKKIYLSGENAIFSQDNEIINLAGVMGGLSTSCSHKTRSVLVECAYFRPENIIGKSVKYDLNSEASYKFERGVDIDSHNYVLRRFIHIVQKHVDIKNLEIFSKEFKAHKEKKIPFNHKEINKIIGFNVSLEKQIKLIQKLGFQLSDKNLIIPSYRGDISNLNDIAEEIARIIGYDNIKVSKITLPNSNLIYKNSLEDHIRGYLIKNGFFEVINSPFSSESSDESIRLENPLDKRKNFLRRNLKESLLEKLLFNENRQKEIVKLFEISNIYTKSCNSLKEIKKLGIIASGRVAKNYKDFSKKIDVDYIKSILDKFNIENSYNIETIPRDSLNSKSKNEIIYFEIVIEKLKKISFVSDKISFKKDDFVEYKPISEYPSSSRDLSFAVKNSSLIPLLENEINMNKNELIKENFIFDYFNNTNTGIIKIGFRFIFQSDVKTITDQEVDEAIDDIIYKTLLIDGVEIPGLKNDN